MTELAIDVQGLNKHFGGKTAVDHASIAQPVGSVWGFLGPNGSGKTTCIRMLCGLLVPDAGRGQCLGFDILTQSAEIRRRTGYMTQKFSFWSDLTIRENLEFVARLYQLGNVRKAVDDKLETLGLVRRQHELAGGLSGGWKQRLALAAVTLHSPKLLLLDEPTAGVDPEARRTFWQEIYRLSQEGMTVLVSTHYMDEAERCDRMVYLAYGKMLASGTAADMIKKSGLVARVSRTGDDVRQYVEPLLALPEVENVNFSGGRLHAVGHEGGSLDAALAKFGQSLDWQAEIPSLDDAFIALEKQSGGDLR
ncbi:ABC transporter ATP-binding protein [Avibacterium sp. 20-126]|uniref:ABC transporter ATP-binding protein n=1 Tax=Avibacterium sp. 20-126 TaxID=2911524 RepID=UPI00218A059B|nr:ABC transporter ATP-binding protein [Avibacterium sp. 20-126]